MGIRIFTCGGTIDSQGIDAKGNYVFGERTCVYDMLEQGRCRLDTIVEELMKKDSLDMIEEDRQKVLQACLVVKENQIVITHGTDKMVQTAKVLGENLKNLADKTIVLLGAMVPYIEPKSDALFNFGGAIYLVQCAPKGVYIAMNGKIFNWNKVRKNTDGGFFEDTE